MVDSTIACTAGGARAKLFACSGLFYWRIAEAQYRLPRGQVRTSMTSWGKKGAATAKFYKGVKGDTAWNKDLLWRGYVKRETEQYAQPAGMDVPMPDVGVAVSAAASKNPPRMRMGVTGTLIPAVAPPDASQMARSAVPALRLSARSSSNRGDLSARSALSSRSAVSSHSAISSRSALSSRSVLSSLGRAPSEYSVGSSISSRAMEDLRDTIRRETQNMQAIARKEIDCLREAMHEETRRREQAERRIDELSALLLDEKKDE